MSIINPYILLLSLFYGNRDYPGYFTKKSTVEKKRGKHASLRLRGGILMKYPGWIDVDTPVSLQHNNSFRESCFLRAAFAYRFNPDIS